MINVYDQRVYIKLLTEPKKKKKKYIYIYIIRIIYINKKKKKKERFVPCEKWNVLSSNMMSCMTRQVHVIDSKSHQWCDSIVIYVTHAIDILRIQMRQASKQALRVPRNWFVYYARYFSRTPPITGLHISIP